MPSADPRAPQVRTASSDDAVALARVYNHYILHTAVTFEETVVSGPDMAVRLAEAQAANLPWLVLERDAEVVGYAHASKWKGRCAYRYSVETTVYLEVTRTGRGYGSLLYEALLAELARGGLHTALAGIALPNAASVALHERFGFRQVAHFAEVGFKFGKWIDVGYWQLQL